LTLEKLGLLKKEETKDIGNGMALFADKVQDGKKCESIYETIKDFWVKNGDYISI
jgi:hypothetical protein